MMMFIRSLALLPVALICAHCTPSKPNLAEAVEEPTLTASKPILQLLGPNQTGIDFQNQIIETYENNITTNINMYNGGGLAVLDINNDGLPDLYFVGANGPNALYLNLGNLTFRNIAESAGVLSTEGFETAATAVDINDDGLLDIYVCRGGPEINEERRNKLYINNGDLTFTERAAAYGLDDKSACTGANFFDYDNDGDLDCYLLHYPTEAIYTNKIEAVLGPDDRYRPLLEPKADYDSDRLYRNDNGKFTDVSKQAGIWNLAYGLSVSVHDFNRDGWTDIYVANDFIQADRLYINNKNGTFTDKIEDYFRHTTQHTMGTDLTDYDNDGLVDLFAVDMLGEKNKRQKSFLATNTQSKYDAMVQSGYYEPVIRNVLQKNNGNNTFSDVGCIAGVYNTDWSWSGLLFDMDNDGLRDLHVTNGYRREVSGRDFADFILPDIQKAAGSGKRLRDIFPDFSEFLAKVPSYKARNVCFANKGDWTFENATGGWMTIPAAWSCGAVWTDLDADGDLDLVVNNLEQPAFIYQNLSRQSNANNFLQIKLQGNSPNLFAVGASVLIRYGDGQLQYQENYPSRGIFSSVEHLTHFGLAGHAAVQSVTVRWPSGTTQTLTNVPVNQKITLKQSDASGFAASIVPLNTNPNPPFKSLAGIPFKHVENVYNDFEALPLLPWSWSDLGPLMASGDVNGDGLDDLFIGNSFDQPGGLWAQQPNGSFTPLSPGLWQQEKAYEDHGAHFFDVDGDGDLDLIVISGGIEARSEVASLAWVNRLYINADGKGTFLRANPQILPQNGNHVGLRATSLDYDGDGDPDLFIGGRGLAGQWPLQPRSQVLRNDNGRFTDVTAAIAPDFEFCGMVTDLAWANIDNTPEPELIVVGEWMPVSVFQWQQGKLVNATTSFGLDQSNGIWYRLGLADLDGDGDLDIVTGNLGLNTRLSASPKGPLKVYAADFDKNGLLDPLIAFFEDGKEYPLYQKEVLTKQMPVLKKRLLYAKAYSEATIDQVFPRKELEAGLVLSAYTLQTCWWENKNGRFIQQSLPLQAQLAPVQGIGFADVNADGHTDIMLAGNKYGFEVETNRADSGNGCVLLGNGKGGFSWMNNLQHGLWATREARDLVVLNNPSGKPIVAISNNDGPLQLYRLEVPAKPPVQ
jgi:hypothetical protein